MESVVFALHPRPTCAKPKLQTLPDEILTQILSHIPDTRTLRNLALVNRRMNLLAAPKLRRRLLAAAAAHSPDHPPLLSRAAAGNNLPLARLLLSLPVAVDTSAALLPAVRRGHMDMCRLLLQHGADPSLRHEPWGMAGMHHAAEMGNIEMMGLLLTHGGCVDARTVDAEVGEFPDGATPLFYAAAAGEAPNLAAMWWLLNQGADPVARDDSGGTPLLACVSAHMYAAAGARDRYGRAAAEGEGGKEEAGLDVVVAAAAWLLLAAGAEAGEKAGEAVGWGARRWGARDGWTALHWAARKGLVATAQLLVEWDAPINAVDEDGDSALHLAIREGWMDVARVLVDAGADREAVNRRGVRAVDLGVPG